MSVQADSSVDTKVLAEFEAALEQRTRELAEAHARETATAEVLKAISSTSDLQKVLDTLLATACRLCEADIGTIRYEEGEGYRLAATFGCRPEWREHFAGYSTKPDRTSVFGQTIINGCTIHIPDVLEDPEYARPVAQKLMSLRAALGVPLMRAGKTFGVISLFRTTPRPFTAKQIALVETFADQAEIAIENARLFKAEQQRSAQLAESLSQQIATADVLKVISRSTFDLQTVLETLANSAGNLCQAENVQIFLRDGGLYQLAAHNGFSLEYQEYIKSHPIAPGRGTVVARTALTGITVHIPDAVADPEYTYHEGRRLGGYRCLLGVPLLREGSCIGVMAMTRAAPQPFTEAQIALVTTFADQAVIAIENVRLFEAEQQRSDELSEALDQQTATAEILKVIAGSPTDVQPVFDAIAQSATRLLSSQATVVTRVVGDEIHLAALTAGSEAGIEEVRGSFPSPLSSSGIHSRVARSGAPAFRTDIESDPEVSAEVKRLARARGYRSILVVPMLREGTAIGTIGITRREPTQFTGKQIDLLKTFADQAVIAIENVRLFQAEQQRMRELGESLEQQTATADVLKVIASSPGALTPVFDALVERAMGLCEADYGHVYTYDGELIHLAVAHGERRYVDWIKQSGPRPLTSSLTFSRLIAGENVAHIGDIAKEPGYRDRNSRARTIVDDFGIHTLLSVALRKDGALLGGIVLYRHEVRPFTDKQIELVKNFAAQAVIAIENTRLLSELRESLEQQTATSEVLEVISSSPGELQPVFESMLANATRICEAKLGSMFLREGAGYRALAVHGDSYYADWSRRDPFIDMRESEHKGTPLERLLHIKAVLHIHDLREDEAYVAGNPRIKALVESAGARTHLVVPLLKEDELIGAIVIYRQEVRPFGEKQIELVQNFAAQAVIAIENTRLLSELRETLERQTATSEVLQVISSSPGELEPVFNAMLENATRICDAKFGNLWLSQGDGFLVAATHGIPPEYRDMLKVGVVSHPGPSLPLSRAKLTRQVVHVHDLSKDQAYLDRESVAVGGVEIGNARTLIAVPMLKDQEVVGAFAIYRQEVRPFNDKQIALVQNFAAQAVIAIENTRLLNELRESLSRQTATSEVLEVISSSPGELQPVFDAMLENAARICQAQFGVMHRFVGDEFYAAATLNTPPALTEFLRQRGRAKAIPGTDMDNLSTSKQVVHTIDMLAAPVAAPPAKFAGARTQLAVPMLKDDELIGAIAIYRQEVRPFTDKQIDLVSNFAAQAVIAIENTRLLNELRERTDDLTESLEQQTATSEILAVISNSLSDTQPVFDAIVQSGMKLFPDSLISVALRDGDMVRPAAIAETDSARAEAWRRSISHTPLAREYMHGAAILDRRVVDVPDVEAAPAEFAAGAQNFLKSGYRAITIMPMMRGDEAIGALSVVRLAPGPLSDKQRAVLRTFANQAVIAIENTRLLNELRERTDDLTESLEQQQASGEILASISGSMADTQPVFDAIVRNLLRLFGTRFAVVQVLRDGIIRMPAVDGGAGIQKLIDHYPRPLDDTTMGGQCMLGKKVIQLSKMQGNPEVPAATQQFAREFGFDSTVFAPMMRDDRVIGAIGIAHHEPKTFGDKQIALIKAFADQAVIAVENTRLFNELRERTDDLTESLEQQTATSEVLKVISSSPGDLDPVFSTILENATNICGAHFGNLFLHDDDGFRAVAMYNAPPGYAEIRKGQAFNPAPDTGLGRMVATKQVFHIADLRDTEGYKRRDPFAIGGVERGGIRTLLAVPMLKDGKLAGAIIIYRQEVRPFSEKQIELVRNFAAQAVIAIENARLLNELRERTDDLSESLEQQTATAEVLSVMSRSKFDLGPILQSVVDTAAKLCRAEQAGIFRLDKDVYRFAAAYSLVPEYLEFEKKTQYLPSPGSVVGRAAMTKQVARIDDVLADPLYEIKAEARVGKVRSAIGVPLMRDGEPVGVIALARNRVEPFTEREIELVTTFADQAVIAIENVRLFDEVQARTEDLAESLQQQTATADVLKVISRSAFDLQSVLDTLIESAARLCEADYAWLFQREGEFFYWAAGFGHSTDEFARIKEFFKDKEVRAERGSITGRCAIEGRVVHVSDVMADPDYTWKGAQAIGNYHAALGAPLLRDGNVVGVIFLSKKLAQPFTDKQIELVTTFADQAVIAIENVRLFEEVQKRTEDLQESLQQQTATADVLKVISRSAFDLQTVLDTLTESAARLCEADMAAIIRQKGAANYWATSYGLPPEHSEYVKSIPLEPGRGTVVGRILLEGNTVHVADVLVDPEYTLLQAQRRVGYRTMLGVPLLRGGTPIGIVLLMRRMVRPFTDKQIELVNTFADQAVIAIENVRLFDEVQKRTEELSESLQQQTATSDVLKIISRSAFDLKTVLDTLLRSAARLCEADQGTITQRMGDKFFRSVAFGYPQEFMDYVKDKPVELNRDTGTGRALLDSKVTHIPDVEADPDYKWADAQRLGGYRAMLGVPMLREGEPIGVLTLTRREPRAFTDKQIELVTTFADQAAIAIENVRLFDEIQEKSHQLEEASKHKSQFLANMSHELRTPLNAILGYTELIADGVYGDTPEKVQATLKRVITNGKHLLGLINDVLDLSKIEAGQLTLSLADYSMKDVVHNVYGAIEPLAAEKKLTFKVDIAPELPAAHGDERRLTQVLLNLVGNAIKFTDEGSVVIKAALKNGMFSVAVVDTGPGISEDDQKKLFQEFQQADSSTTKKKGGTGLGLAISKRIVELHGGSVSLESRVGAGSTFAFTIPVRAEQTKRAMT